MALSKNNRKEQIHMTHRHDTETERPSDPWAEETYSMDDREPLPWQRHGPLPPEGRNPHRLAARGFAQSFQLCPTVALVAIVSDCMCSAVDVASLGITVPFLWLIAGLFNGVIVFLGQKKWGGDDQEGAFIKALIISFLIALPTPFPAFLTVPSAVVGFFRRKK